MNDRARNGDPLSLPIAIALVLATAGIWEYAANSSTTVRLLASSPSLIVEHVTDKPTLVVQSLWHTGLEAGLGMIFAILVSLFFGAFYFIWPRLASITYPWLVASQVVPFVAIAPMAILLFGPTGPWGKVALSTLITFFPILSNIVAGFRSIRQESLDIMMMMNASKTQTLRHVIIPSCLPHFFAGLRIAAPLSVIGAIIAEFSGADHGIGKDIFVSAKRLEPETMMTGIICGALLAGAIYLVVLLWERTLGPWYWEN